MLTYDHSCTLLICFLFYFMNGKITLFFYCTRFLSALAVIAEVPELLQKIIITKEVHELI